MRQYSLALQMASRPLSQIAWVLSLTETGEYSLWTLNQTFLLQQQNLCRLVAEKTNGSGCHHAGWQNFAHKVLLA